MIRPESEKALIRMHVIVVMNMLNTMLGSNEYFRIVIADPSKKYANQLPPEVWNNNKVILDMSGWSFEQAHITQTAEFCTTVVIGADSLYDITIDLLDIESITIARMPEFPMYIRPFSFTDDVNQPAEPKSSEPLPDWHRTATAYELTNERAIAKSITSMTLLKKDIP